MQKGKKSETGKFYCMARCWSSYRLGCQPDGSIGTHRGCQHFQLKQITAKELDFANGLDQY
jgi:hypothetical protein